MYVVSVQKTLHCCGDLTLKIVHDDQGRCIVSSRLTNTVDLRDNTLLHVLDHGRFIRPMLW